MNKDLKKLHNHLKGIVMTQEEKRSTRGAVLFYIEQNPYTASEKSSVVSPYQSEISAWSFVKVLHNFRFQYTSLAFAIILIAGSGISAAAEGTVPGDLLYVVKTDVNENVKGWLAISHESKVSLEAQFAETRLKEVEKLAVENKLSPEVKADLESKFKTHADNFKAGVKVLESQGKLDAAAGASSKFESSLNAHENVLLTVGETSGGDATAQTISVAEMVKAEATVVSDARVVIEEKVKNDTDISSTETSANDSATLVKGDVSELTIAFKESKGVLSSDFLDEANSRLGEASVAISDAYSKLQTKDFAEAYILFQKAHRITGEIKTMLNADKELDSKIYTKDTTIKTNNPTTATTTTVKVGNDGSSATTTATTTISVTSVGTTTTITASTTIVSPASGVSGATVPAPKTNFFKKPITQ